jgi:hypothetical protein
MAGGIHPPLSVIESWPSRSANPERRGWDVFTAMIVLYTLCTVVVALRLWARLRLQRNPGLDDLFIVFSMVRLFLIQAD